jgi:hypothetical protein
MSTEQASELTGIKVNDIEDYLMLTAEDINMDVYEDSRMLLTYRGNYGQSYGRED